MNAELQTAAYIAATVLFILSLGGLKDQESAKRGVWFGIVGMAIAVLATIFGPIDPHDITLGTVLAAKPNRSAHRSCHRRRYRCCCCQTR